MMMRMCLASCCQVEVTNLRTTACNFLIEVLAFAMAEDFLHLALKYGEQQKDVNFPASHGPSPTPVSNYMPKVEDEVTSSAKHPSGPLTPQTIRVQRLSSLLSRELRGFLGDGCG